MGHLLPGIPRHCTYIRDNKCISVWKHTQMPKDHRSACQWKEGDSARSWQMTEWYAVSETLSSSAEELFKTLLCRLGGVVAVQSPSRVQLFASSWAAARQPPLSSAISQSLPKLMPTDAMIPSNHLILCRPLLLLPSISPSIRVFSDESALCIRWPKHWSFSISPSDEYSGLISIRFDWLDLLESKGLSRVFSNTTVWKHRFFGTQPTLWSNSHVRTWLLEIP